MMYYRVAIQASNESTWKWKSTALSSLDTLFQWLRLYRALPQDRLRVFSSSSREEMNEQLARENRGDRSTSVTVVQFLRERLICSQDAAGEVVARGPSGNGRKTPLAVPAYQSLREESRGENTPGERGTSALEQSRAELERGAGGDNDIPYRFSLPTSQLQVLTWKRLKAKVQAGELQP
jgi:hypothetical protein